MTSFENELLSKKRNEKIELIINHQVEGEAFIISSSHHWKRIVLQNFNRIYRNEIGINELLKVMQEHGVVFAQKDSLVRYPVLECLNFIAKQSNEKLEISEVKNARL
ncbi:hypothetical protein [Ferdinandcohnia sp. SAFN-114]|uniref:hypothetical protein n=1 Tax=Ferdinandcohnia sp. SAFN-114 TaxID=3387275 RepID=UPI003F81FCC7